VVIAVRVTCRYIGVYTLHTCENRDACWTAIAFCSGSISRVAFWVFWPLTVGYT
jgi:hypothetical protein